MSVYDVELCGKTELIIICLIKIITAYLILYLWFSIINLTLLSDEQTQIITSENTVSLWLLIPVT